MKTRTCFVSNSSSSSFIVSMDRPNGIDDYGAVCIRHLSDQLSDVAHWLKSHPDDKESLQEQKDIVNQIERYQKYAKDNDAYVFDLRVAYGDEDIIYQLRDVLPNFHVLNGGGE